jgi:hypothetical protein
VVIALNASRSARRPRWPAVGVGLWAVNGAMYGFAVASLPSIGLWLVAPAVLLTLILARSARTSEAWPAVIAGPAVPLVWLAYLNRSGPGTVCRGTATAQSCTEQYAPAPFLIAAAVMVLVSALLFVRARRRS